MEMLTFQRPHGEAWNTVKTVLQSSLMRRTKVTYRYKGLFQKKLVIGIGQIHPVLRGRFENFLVKKIAKTQHWIFQCTEMLHKNLHVRFFGREGFGSMNRDYTQTRISSETKTSIIQSIEKNHSLLRHFHEASKVWQKNARRNQQEESAKAMMLFDSLTVLQALYPHTGIFPLEDSHIHGTISEKINIIQNEIVKIEQSKPFQDAKKNNGKNLTKEAYDAVRKRNKQIDEFHALLKSPERDHEIFERILGASKNQPITVFVLGNAHQSSMLKLAKKNIDRETLFLWITPPQLWWWQNICKKIGWSILFAATLILWMLS